MSDSDDASIPPVAQPAVATAAQLGQSHSHPLWEKAAGRGSGGGGSSRGATGRGRGRGGGGGGSNAGDAPRYEPLSALALEMESFRKNADGDSALFSDAGSSIARPPRARQKANDEVEDDDDDEDAQGFSALASSDEEDDGAHGKKRKKHPTKGKAKGNGDGGMFAQAAFGGAAYDAGSDAESVSQLSGTSSQRQRAAYRSAFPFKGVDCVGCMLNKQITPVIRFVKDNLTLMSEEALWKSAACVYIREVQEPRKREGVLTPAWGHKDIRSHFLLHCSDHLIARTFACRQLQTMRMSVEQRLMRVDGDTKEVDKQGCELMLKVRAQGTTVTRANMHSLSLPMLTRP